MFIKQLSIFLENESGRLTEVLASLARENISIKALSIADTTEYGILRLIVPDPEKAYQLLKNRNFTVNLTEVLSVTTPVKSGSFANAISKLSDAGISIAYMYAFSFNDKAAIFMRTEDTDHAVKVLREMDLEVLTEKDLFSF